MIGIFDSGVGGMTVARAIEKELPHCRLVYFGDLARTPYGSKSAETIRKYAVENSKFLLARGAEMIIIACNSAASVASDLLREKFSVPVFEVITPAVRQVVRTSIRGRIGIIGTRATIKSRIYEKKIKKLKPEFQVFGQPGPLLVPLVEEGWLNKRETKMIIRRYLHPLKLKNIDTLVLGCTHYPLLKKLIQPRIGRQINVIDSSRAIAVELADFLRKKPDMVKLLSSAEENEYYVSDITEAASATAERIFGRRINLKIP
jgi:glutamate racemase